LNRSHVLLLCGGLFAWNKYPVVKKRPSARVDAFLKQSSSLGFAFIQLIASEPDVFAFLHLQRRHRAFRWCVVAE
jgi:hypothetical protein